MKEEQKAEIIKRLQSETINVLSYSYGKDSGACIGACQELGIPIHAIVTADVWATDTIPADFPTMVQWKEKVDAIIKQMTGLDVIHVCAMDKASKRTYDSTFYHVVTEKTIKKRMNQKREGQKCHAGNNNAIYGFPCTLGAWCNSRLKVAALKEAEKMTYEKLFHTEIDRQTDRQIVSIIGIALDEPERLQRLDNIKKVSPLELIGWTEADCMEWCIKNDLRSPTYDDSKRGGCWFCHNQSVDQLRKLRSNYPDLWSLLMKWDSDSPVTFHADGRTVHDFDRRFEAEEKGYISKEDRFKWKDLEEMQETLFTIYGFK